jgi:ATP-dependent protease ClpP protease subunit
MNRQNKNNSQQVKPKNGKKHTWVLEEIPKFKVQIPIVKQATIYVSEFDEEKTSIFEFLDDIKTFGPDDKINMLFNSPGGLISEGRAMINAILSTGSDLQTTILSQAASMAAIMFCIGDRRVIYETSSIMFHNYSSGYYGKGHELEDYIEHTSENLRLFFKSYIIGFTDEEIDQLLKGKDFWFGSKAMAERGLATHIDVNGILIPSEKYLVLLKKAKKLAKKKGYKIQSIGEAILYGIDVISEVVKERNAQMDKVGEVLSEMVGQNEFLHN